MGNAWTVIPVIGNLLISSSSYSFNNFQYASLGFVLLAAAIIFSWVSGLLGYKIGMKKGILIGLLFFFFANLLFSLANFRTNNEAFWILLIGEGLLGISIGGLLASVTSYIVFLVPNKTPMVLTGVYFCVNFGSFSYPILFNLFSSGKFWWHLTILQAVLSLLLVVVGWKFLPDIRNPNPLPLHTFREAFRHLSFRFWIFFAVIIGFSITENTFDSWVTIFLHQVKDLSISKANFGLSSYWATVAIGQVSVCVLVRWISPRWIYRILPLFLIVGYFGIYYSEGYFYNLLFYIISALGCSAFFALTMSFVEGEYKVVSEIASGVMVTAYFLGSALGSLIFGTVLGANVINLKDLIFLFGFITVVIFGVNQYLMNKRTAY